MLCTVVGVTSPAPGIKELIVHGHSWFVVDSGDTVGAAEAIATVFGRGPKIDDITEQARRHVEQRFAAIASEMTLRGAWATSVSRRRG